MEKKWNEITLAWTAHESESRFPKQEYQPHKIAWKKKLESPKKTCQDGNAHNYLPTQTSSLEAFQQECPGGGWELSRPPTAYKIISLARGVDKLQR